ncbi:MAG: hypothetical protein QOD96_7511 [Pseudonocardiales bacterium]|nr:hypothetical protein [Pseudonocardiales bacterium]
MLLAALPLGGCGADHEPAAGGARTATTAATSTSTTAAAASTSATAATATSSADPDATRTNDVTGDDQCAGSRPSIVDGASAATVPSATPAGATATTAASGATAPADQATLARPFSTGSPWNTPVGGRPTDSRSDAWIASASRRVAVVAAADEQSVDTTERQAHDLRLYVNTCAWTPVIVGEDGGEPVRFVCRQRDCGEVAKQVRTLRVPQGQQPFPEFDGWYSVIDQSAKVGYDMWRARRVGDVISYQFIKRWRLDGPGFSAPATEAPAGAGGARGSGLPLFAGVIQPDELRRGRIEHALAISVPGPAQRIFTQPASVTNGINVIGSLPEGARLRLKSGVALPRLPGGANRRSAEAIVTALRTYGAIVVDRSITPTLYARRSSGYGSLLLGNEVQGIRMSDLEVVQSGELLRFPPLESTPEKVQG